MGSNLAGKIDHLVVLMLENRGFDSVLGYLYGQTDRPAHYIPPLPKDALPFIGLDFVDLPSLANQTTFDNVNLNVQPGPGVRTANSPGANPGEEYPHVNAQLYNIKATTTPPSQAPNMLGFLADYAARMPATATTADVAQIMHMYTPADLPVLNRLAKAYAVSDMWFSSVPTQTNANRAFSLCGTSLGLVDNGYLSGMWPAKWAKDKIDTPTFFNVLANNNVTSWAVFWERPYILTTNPYTRSVFPQLSALGDRYFMKMNQFYELASSGKLPQLSYIEPDWSGVIDPIPGATVAIMGNDCHPPNDTTPAEHLVRRIYDSLSANPSTWNKTLFVIVFDEHGGTYDHVPPPSAVPPWGNDSNPKLPQGRQYNFNFDRLGLRVPALFISPLVEGQTVLRAPGATPFDHTSIVATILEWMLPGVPRQQWNLGERVMAAPTFDTVVTLTTPRNIDPFLPAGAVASPLQYGSPFQLEYKNTGLFLTQAKRSLLPPSGTPSAEDQPDADFADEAGLAGVPFSLDFARVASVGPQDHELRGGYGDVTDGDIVQLRTSEYLEPPMSEWTNIAPVYLAIRNMLCQWTQSGSSFYYSPDDGLSYFLKMDHNSDRQKYRWKISRVGNSGGPILNGDRVQLLNQYAPWKGNALTVQANSYLASKADSNDYWTIHPAGCAKVAPLWTEDSNQSQAKNRVHVFWRAEDGSLQDTYWTDNGWLTVPLDSGPVVSDPTAVFQLSPSSSIDIFWRGAGGSLKHTWWVAGGPWQTKDLQVSAALSPTAVPYGSSNLVFYCREDRTLSYMSGSGGSWQENPILTTEPLASRPRPVVAGEFIHVFWRAVDGSLKDTWSSADEPEWTTETVRQDVLASDPMPLFALGTLHIFWRTPSGALARTWLAGDIWSYDIPSIDPMSSDPMPLLAGNTIHVFWRSLSGHLMDTFWTGESWLTVTLSTEPLASDPVPLYDPAEATNPTGPGVIHVFWHNSDGVLKDTYYANGTWAVTIIAGGPAE